MPPLDFDLLTKTMINNDDTITNEYSTNDHGVHMSRFMSVLFYNKARLPQLVS